MIHKIEMFGCTCDNCGKQWENYDGIVCWSEEEHVSDSIDSDGWHKADDGKTYCDDCYYVDDDDNIIIKVERKKN